MTCSDEDAAGLLHLPGPGVAETATDLRAHRVPFVEAQRPVVDAARQAEAVFGERDLAPVVARAMPPICGTVWWLSSTNSRRFGQIFEQGRRRLAGQAAGEEAAVILDAGAGAGGGDHLEVEIGALLEPLRLEQLALGDQLLEPLGSSCLIASIACLSVGPASHSASWRRP
jgi:hypothetical protein